MRRRDEDRLVEQILPVAGEFLLGDDVCLDGATDAIGKHDGIADLGFGRVAESQRRQIELASACTRPNPVSWS